jgi:predicted dehydrogenase
MTQTHNVAVPQPVSWILVGTGDIVHKRVGPALAGRVHAVVGSHGRAEDLAKTLQAPHAFGNLGDALKNTAAEAVYIATPVHRHLDEALAALAAGRHVLVEKPLALNHADASTLVAAVKPGQVAGCAYYRRFFPRFTHLKDTLGKGDLGKIVHVRMANWSWFNPAESDPKRWRTIPAQSGGGPLSDVGVHMFDLLISALGLPTRVFARCDNLVHAYQAEDSSTVLMTLPNGAHVTATFGWNSKTWRHDLEVVGTEGKILWLPCDTGKVQITVGRETNDIDLPNHANVHQPLIDDFERAVRQNGAPVCTFEQAARTNRLLDAIYRSAASGRDEEV